MSPEFMFRYSKKNLKEYIIYCIREKKVDKFTQKRSVSQSGISRFTLNRFFPETMFPLN